jgi:YidC/Oxa1 family membrane protein insertase
MFDSLAALAFPLVTGLAGLVHPLFGTAATAAAIVLATMSARLLLVPVGYAAHRADRRRADLVRRVGELRDTHAADPATLEIELGALYRAEGGGMLRGCLPALVQIPVFAALYQLAVSPTVGGQVNTVLQQTLFGIPLGSHLIGTGDASQLLVFAALIALLAAIGLVSSRVLGGSASAGPAGVLVRVLPYASAVTAVFLPLAAGLYLVTTTAWTVAQTLRQL